MNTPMLPAAELRQTVRERYTADIAEEIAVRSGVSWGAIIAGAAGAAALSLILLILGTGLGLSSVSPWTGQGASAMTFGVSTILWLTFTQLAASGMGGYLAGRLRTKWGSLHTDEVYFRDTAHGFLAWAVATLVTAGFLGSVVGSIVNGGVQAGASIVGGAATTVAAGAGAAEVATSKSDSTFGDESAGMGYFVDSLFRKDLSTTSGATPSVDASAGTSTAEVVRIFANDLRAGSLTPADTRYVGQLVSQRTGLTQPDAEKRVTEIYSSIQSHLKNAETTAREAADKARKASAGAALWMFVALLIGAFIASLAATYGGRRRDF